MLVLALLVLPTVTLVLDGQLRLVAPELRLTAAALGLTKAQTLVRLALPQCGQGLKAAAALGFGRAVGDTLIALMLSGNAAQVPHSPLDSLRALTAHRPCAGARARPTAPSSPADCCLRVSLT
jgi:phosphate transport system permease protein